MRYNDLRSEASKNAAQRNTVTVSRRRRAFRGPVAGLVVTSTIHRFSFGQKKIIVRGVSTIRAISQWTGITSDRELKVDHRKVCRRRRNNSARSLFGRHRTCSIRFTSRHLKPGIETGWKGILIFRNLKLITSTVLRNGISQNISMHFPTILMER